MVRRMSVLGRESVSWEASAAIVALKMVNEHQNKHLLGDLLDVCFCHISALPKSVGARITWGTRIGPLYVSLVSVNDDSPYRPIPER